MAGSRVMGRSSRRGPRPPATAYDKRPACPPDAFSRAPPVGAWGFPYLGAHLPPKAPTTALPRSEGRRCGRSCRGDGIREWPRADSVNVTTGIYQTAGRLDGAFRRRVPRCVVPGIASVLDVPLHARKVRARAIRPASSCFYLHQQSPLARAALVICWQLPITRTGAAGRETQSRYAIRPARYARLRQPPGHRSTPPVQRAGRRPGTAAHAARSPGSYSGTARTRIGTAGRPCGCSTQHATTSLTNRPGGDREEARRIAHAEG